MSANRILRGPKFIATSMFKANKTQLEPHRNRFAAPISSGLLGSSEQRAPNPGQRLPSHSLRAMGAQNHPGLGTKRLARFTWHPTKKTKKKQKTSLEEPPFEENQLSLRATSFKGGPSGGSVRGRSFVSLRIGLTRLHHRRRQGVLLLRQRQPGRSAHAMPARSHGSVQAFDLRFRPLEKIHQ